MLGEQRELTDRVRDWLHREIDRVGGAEHWTSDGNGVTVTRSARPDCDWQLTSWHADGPWGHSCHGSLDDLARRLVEDYRQQLPVDIRPNAEGQQSFFDLLMAASAEDPEPAPPAAPPAAPAPEVGEVDVEGDVVRIDAHQLTELRKRVDAVNKKIARLGVGRPLTIEVVGRGQSKREETFDAGPRAGVALRPTKFAIPYVDVRIDGVAPVVSGWIYAASLEHHGPGKATVRLQDERLLDHVSLDDLTRAEPHCDHCRLDRRRKDTFMLLRQDGSEAMQVGCTCLADFLGSAQATDAVKYWNLYVDIIDTLREEGDEFSEGRGGGDAHVAEFSLSALLETLYCILTEPDQRFVSTAEERDRGGLATWRRALDRMSSWPRHGDDPRQCVAEREAHAEDTYTRSVDIALWIIRQAADNPRSEFWANCAALVRDDEDREDYGTAVRRPMPDMPGPAMLAAAVARYVEGQRAADLPAATDEHLGTPGDRLERVITLSGAPREVESRYGVSHLYKFVDQDGHRLSYFASRPMTYDQGEGGLQFAPLEPGESYRAKFTIKKHGDYRGQIETAITRATVIEPVAAGTRVDPKPARRARSKRKPRPNAMPVESGPWYHGAGDDAVAERILAEGVLREGPGAHKEDYERAPWLTPLSGRVYVTDNLYTAVNYGAHAAHNEYGEPQAYWVFEADAAGLPGDVDEDLVAASFIAGDLDDTEPGAAIYAAQTARLRGDVTFPADPATARAERSPRQWHRPAKVVIERADERLSRQLANEVRPRMAVAWIPEEARLRSVQGPVRVTGAWRIEADHLPEDLRELRQLEAQGLASYHALA